MLFDLDNTLILFDESEFYKVYTEKLYLRFQNLMTAHEFGLRMKQAITAMIKNNGRKMNGDVFFDSFINGLSIDPEKLVQRFNEFYSNGFNQLHYLMTPLENVYSIVEFVRQKGYTTVIATNPVFPMNAQELRLKWAGLEAVKFDLITSVENSRFCKPNLQYYLEICKQIDISPEHCLMVGNDIRNDMIASKIGMKTYLTTDSDERATKISQEMIQNTGIQIQTPAYKGPLNELINVFDNM